MKKTVLFFLLALGFYVAIGQVQQGPVMTIENPGSPSREYIAGFDCVGSSLYSQLVPYEGAQSISFYASNYEGSDWRVFDEILVTPGKPVDMVTFWGGTGSVARNFEIAFFRNTPPEPKAPLAIFNVFITPEYVPYWATIYRYHVVLPSSVSLQAGDLISIAADGAQGYWYWTMSNDGNLTCFQTPDNYKVHDVAFCLGTSAEIPLSPYALLLGFGLILAAVIYRARRF